MHAVERTRLLFARALNYPLPITKGDYGVRARLDVDDKRPAGLLFFHGTARAEKLWPEDHWLELAALAAGAGYKVWLPWGNQAEQERAQRIATAADNAEVLPGLSLAGLAGLLLEVDGAVAVDTGLGHLSAALDVPTVSLYGPTRVELIGAYGANQVHIQSPLGEGDTTDPALMMSSIDAPSVWCALQSILPPGPSP
jgi:heptosyltransferase-1